MKVLIATASFGKYDRNAVNLLGVQGIETKFNYLGRQLTSPEILELAEGCVGIIAGTERYSEEILKRLPSLKVISRCGGGLDGIDLEAARRLGIVVTSTPYGPTQAVAELTVGFILSLIRHVETSTAMLKRGQWEKRMGFLTSELTVGIVGLGRIGKLLSTLMRMLGSRVVGCDIKPDLEWAQAQGVEVKSFEEVLKESDVVCLHMPYQKEFHHLIGRRELAIMKPGSFLVNTSRGGLVDEEALGAALSSGHITGAALDTFEQEPYKGPLAGLDNVILTPHLGSYARAGRIKMERESVENLIAEFRQLGPLTTLPFVQKVLRSERKDALPLRAVILDFDGVVAESVEVKTRAYAKLFEQEGPEVVEKVVTHHREHGGISRFEKIRYYYETILGRRISEEGLAMMCERFGELVRQGVIQAPLVSGAQELFEYCKTHGILLFIVSATPEQEMKMIVELRGLSHYFSGIFGSPAKKSELLRSILSTYLFKPQEVLFIGDAVDDWEAASAVGIPFVARQHQAVSSPWLLSGIRVVTDLTGLREYLIRDVAAVFP